MRLKEILTLFVSSVNLLRYEHLRGLPKLTIDLPLAGLAELCSIWRGRTPGPFVLHHDRSTQLASDRKILKTPLSRDIPPKESSAGDRHAIFPVNVLPSFVQPIAWAFPTTWWLEASRRGLVGHGSPGDIGNG